MLGVEEGPCFIGEEGTCFIGGRVVAALLAGREGKERPAEKESKKQHERSAATIFALRQHAPAGEEGVF